MTTNVALAAAPPAAPTVAFSPPLVTPAAALPAAAPIVTAEIALARLPPATRAGTLPPLTTAGVAPVAVLQPAKQVGAQPLGARQPRVLVLAPPLPLSLPPISFIAPLSWKDTASRILNLTLLNRASEHISFSLRREHFQAVKQSWSIQGGLFASEAAFSFLLMPIRVIGKLIVLASRFLLFIAAAFTSLASGYSIFVKEAGKLLLLSLLRTCVVLPAQLLLQILNTLAGVILLPIGACCKVNPNKLFRLSRRIDHYFDQWEVFVDNGNYLRLALQPKLAKRYGTEPAYRSRFCNYVFARPTIFPPLRTTQRRHG